MELYTERLQLRPWEEADAEKLFLYASDHRVGPPAGWKPHTSVEDSLQIIRAVLSAEGTFAVVLKETRNPVGSVGLILNKENKHSKVMGQNDGEIGYWIAVPFWGRELIPEAVRELIRYGFEELSLDNLWCGYYEGNDKSRRVQEKCGFIYHHTENEKLCPALNETRTEHFTVLSGERWEREMKGRGEEE